MKYSCFYILLSLASLPSYSQLINYEEWQIVTNRIKEINVHKVTLNQSKNDTILICVLLYDTSGRIIQKKESFNASKTAYISTKYKYRYSGVKSITETEIENPFSLKAGQASLPLQKICELYKDNLLQRKESERENGEKEMQEYIYDSAKLLLKSIIYINREPKLPYTVSYKFF